MYTCSEKWSQGYVRMWSIKDMLTHLALALELGLEGRRQDLRLLRHLVRYLV